MTETTLSPLNNVITIDDERIKNHLDRVVRSSVEETLNANFWMRRRIGFVTPSVTSAALPAAIPALATTSATCRPRRARCG